MLRFSLACLWVLLAGSLSLADDRPPSPQLPRGESDVVVLTPEEQPAAGDQPSAAAAESAQGFGREMVDFSLTDQLGRTVTKESLLGTPWVANFIFSTCPSHCPATLNEIFHLQRRLEDEDVKFVTITVDPKTDTVARLHELSKAFGADPERWLFLTGDAAEIQKVIMQGFLQPFESNPMRLAHSLNLMQVDAQGRVVGKYRYHFEEPDAPDQLNVLRKVLEGEIEIPEENRFLGTQITLPELPGEQTPASETETDPAGSPVAEADQPAVARPAPTWVERLRSTNALLNAVATVLLLMGFTAILSGHIEVHKRLMLMAFGTSVAFLVCYLTYHGALHHFTGKGHKPYSGNPEWLTAYRTILWSHIALAAVTPVLAIITIYRGLAGLWDSHRRIARVTFPIWLYVSVTGVIIYFMNA